MATKETSLTKGEQNRLAKHETIIESGVGAFVEVGKALIAIQNEHLYTDVADTFVGYCKLRWGFAKSRAYQLIDAAKVVDVVSTIGGHRAPVNERQARVLAELPTEQIQATVWVKSVETAPKDKAGNARPTAAHIAKVAREFVSPKKPAKPKPAQAPTEAVEPPEPTKPEPTPEPNTIGDFAEAHAALVERHFADHPIWIRESMRDIGIEHLKAGCVVAQEV